MSEPTTLGELLAELDRRSVLQPGAEGFLGNAAMTHTYGNAASLLRNILHGTDEAPGLVERVVGLAMRDVVDPARDPRSPYLEVMDIERQLTAEISTDGKETT